MTNRPFFDRQSGLALAFHMPIKPFTVVDAINRRAAATGSIGYAQANAYSDFNGHHASLSWNNYRQYYVGDYHWGERVVIARNANLRGAIDTALRWYETEGRGGSLDVWLRPVDVPVVAEFPELRPGSALSADCDWRTWKHRCAGEAVRLEFPQHGGVNWPGAINRLLQAETKEQWDATKYGASQ